MNGDLRAVDGVLSVMERRDRLLGSTHSSVSRTATRRSEWSS